MAKLVNGGAGIHALRGLEPKHLSFSYDRCFSTAPGQWFSTTTPYLRAAKLQSLEWRLGSPQVIPGGFPVLLGPFPSLQHLYILTHTNTPSHTHTHTHPFPLARMGLVSCFISQSASAKNRDKWRKILRCSLQLRALSLKGLLNSAEHVFMLWCQGKIFLFQGWKATGCMEAEIPLPNAGTRKTTSSILTASSLVSHHLFPVPARHIYLCQAAPTALGLRP